MRIRQSGRLVILLAVLTAFFGAPSAGIGNPLPQNQPGPTDSSDSGCYCGIPLCGCAQPPSGYTLDASCTCGGSGCTRTCSYTQTKPSS